MAITAIADDSGTAGDFITNDTTLTVSGTNGALGAGEKVQVSSDGGTTWSDVTTSDATTWSFTDPTDHGASFTYQARIVDAAGNVGTTASQAVTIDTSMPTAAVAITAIADDSGTAGDFITSDTTLTVSGTHGALGAGEKIQVSSDGGTTWSDVTTSDATTWSYTDPTTHGASFTYQARIVDTAGNVGNTASQAVTIDTSSADGGGGRSPRLPPTAARAGDFITNDTTLTVSGTHGALGAGEKVQVSSDGGTTWTDVTTSDATHLELHRSHHPRRELHLPGADDRYGGQCRQQRQPGGHHRHRRRRRRRWRSRRLPTTAARAGDFITSDTTLTVSGTNGALGAGEKVQVSSDGGTTWTDVVPEHRHDLELCRPDHARRELHLPGADRRCGGQCRHHRQPGGHDRHGGADGGAGDHGDCRRQRHGGRLHHQRHHADGLRHQRRARRRREDAGQQRRRRPGPMWSQGTATSWSYVDPTTHAASFTYQARIIDAAANVGTTASQARHDHDRGAYGDGVAATENTIVTADVFEDNGFGADSNPMGFR